MFLTAPAEAGRKSAGSFFGHWSLFPHADVLAKWRFSMGLCGAGHPCGSLCSTWVLSALISMRVPTNEGLQQPMVIALSNKMF